MSNLWQPAWTKHEHLLPAFREKISAHGQPGGLCPSGLPPFRLHDGQEIDWRTSPNGSDEGLLRFLQARNGNIEQAAVMFVKQLEWRRHAFPIHREGNVAEILDEALPHKERRFAKMGINPEGLPVMKQDFMWAKFTTERYSALDCIRAYLLFLEENVVMAPTMLERQMVVLSYGGFCPADWGRSFAATLQDNYPERLVRAVIWPVPDFLCKIVRSFCYLFCSKELNAKIAIETQESKMLAITRLKSEQLPDYMQGGIEDIIARDKPDPDLIRKLVMDGFRTAGKSHELQDWPWRSPVTRAANNEQVRRRGTGTAARSDGGCSEGILFSLCGCFGRGGQDPAVQERTLSVEPDEAESVSSVAPAAVATATRKTASSVPLVSIAIMLVFLLVFWQTFQFSAATDGLRG